MCAQHAPDRRWVCVAARKEAKISPPEKEGKKKKKKETRSQNCRKKYQSDAAILSAITQNCDSSGEKRRVHRLQPAGEDVAFKSGSLRSLPPAKVHFYLQTWIDVSVPHSCSGKVSPSTANNSTDARQVRPAASASPSVAPYHACREAAVCVCALVCVCARASVSVRRALRSTDGTGSAEGARSLRGHLPPPANPSATTKRRRCNKTWPGRGQEWMPSIR